MADRRAGRTQWPTVVRDARSGRPSCGQIRGASWGARLSQPPLDHRHSSNLCCFGFSHVTPQPGLARRAPAGDGAVDVGRDAGDDVGGGVEEPLQPDAVEDGGDQAHFDVDLGRGEGRDVAGIDRLLQVSWRGWRGCRCSGAG